MHVIAMNAMPRKGDILSRRNFLNLLGKGSLAGSALISMGVLVRYLSFQSETSSSTQYDLGLETNYPLGSRITVQSVPATIIHDSQGYHAISLICPHLGCVVKAIGDGFACPCHGSRFLPDGSLRNGPASKSLTILRVETNAEGHLILFTTK